MDGYGGGRAGATVGGGALAEAERAARAAEALDGPALYEADELVWVARQVAALREGRLADLDRESLAEHLTDVSKSEPRELRNRLAVLLAHILKVRHQPDRHTESWNATILEQQRRARLLLKETPSLARRAPELHQEAHELARYAAVRETGLPLATFPPEPPMDAEAALAFVPPEPPPHPSAPEGGRKARRDSRG